VGVDLGYARSNAEDTRPIIPPTAIDWIADRIVTSLLPCP
jgi:hypothetical protein